MHLDLNHLNQPIGIEIPNWKPCPFPNTAALEGQYCRVVPLDVEAHVADLFEAFGLDEEGSNWTYLPYGPFADFESYKTWLISISAEKDPLFYSIVDIRTSKAVGVASYLRIDPNNGSIEVGHLNFSPLLQRSIAATEAMFLMMQYAFDLGYRRYEWKCNAANEPSMKAAKRLGFRYEGTFRQSAIVKGRNRDTAWFSIIDGEWASLKAAFEHWLHPHNFDEKGIQKTCLSQNSHS